MIKIRKWFNRKGFSQIAVLLILLVLSTFLVTKYVIGNDTDGGILPSLKESANNSINAISDLNQNLKNATDSATP